MMSNKRTVPFGKKAVSLLSDLTNTIHNLRAIGYLNDAQLAFIEQYAFKCDDALAAAASYTAKVAKISQHQVDDLTDNSSSTVIATSASTIKSEPLETITPVLIEATPTTTSTNAIRNDDTTSCVVVKPILSKALINSIQRNEKVINNFFTASPLPTPGCGLKEEFMSAPAQVEKLHSTQNNPISADVEPDVEPDVVVDDIKFAGFLQKCAEKGIKPSCGSSQALEANLSAGTHDDIGIKDADTASKFATSTVKVEPEVMSGAIQANTAVDTEDDDIVKNLDIPSIIVTSTAVEPEVPSSSTQTEIPSNENTSTVISDASIAAVVPESTAVAEDGSHIEELSIQSFNNHGQKDEVEQRIETVETHPESGSSESNLEVESHIESAEILPEFVSSEAKVEVEPHTESAEVFPGSDSSKSKAQVESHIETTGASLESDAKTEATSNVQEPALPKSEQKLDVKLQIENSSKTQNLPKIPGGPKIENRRPNRSHGMVVRFMEGGPKNGKRNITLLARVSAPYGSQHQQHEWATTRHCPGTVIMARENQQSSAAGDMMPFLNIQRGDLLILKEERSPNIYLVKQKFDNGLEGLIRIYRTDMKAADAVATSIQGDDSQSEKSGSKSSRENSPITRGRARAGVLKDKTNISGNPSSSKSPTGIATKPAIERQDSAPPKPMNEVKAPRVPAPGFENTPHMIAARMYDANPVPKVYVEEPLPKRTRYVDIWTPHLTDGLVLAPGML